MFTLRYMYGTTINYPNFIVNIIFVLSGSGSFDDRQFGDPSPSFFPIKPSNKLNQFNQFISEKDILREKLATSHSTPATPGSPRKHNHGNLILLNKIEKVEVLCPAPST